MTSADSKSPPPTAKQETDQITTVVLPSSHTTASSTVASDIHEPTAAVTKSEEGLQKNLDEVLAKAVAEHERAVEFEKKADGARAKVEE